MAPGSLRFRERGLDRGRPVDAAEFLGGVGVDYGWAGWFGSANHPNAL
jgi:hypothetical protein